MNAAAVRFPLCFLDRLRMATDGQGVTTLVGAYGCPLRCHMCLNPQSWMSTEEGKGYEWVTPTQLYDRVKIDNLYYLATGGGVTFGGGEPLAHAEFMKAFRAICPTEWHFCAETCLSVPPEKVDIAARVIDRFYVDIKDMNPAIYRAYTGQDNDLTVGNLRRLLSLCGPERITVRVPRIPNFNTPEDVERSVTLLRDMGFVHLDVFTYRQPKR